jgi:hypothetical protein
MQGVFSLMAVVVVMAATYFIFRLVGPRRATLLLPLDEKTRWDTTVVPRIGGPLVVASLVGTLTSLATAYLFFIGSSKIFGYWIFACPVAIFGGAFITKAITRSILNSEDVRERIIGGTQQSGVIARIFWTDSPAGKACAMLVKWISMGSILGAIWLEFALFSDILGHVLKIDSVVVKAAICALATFVVADFTLRYGLRGFVFADAFHAPLLALATLALVFAATLRYAAIAGPSPFSLSRIHDIAQPIVSTNQGLLFILHVFILNSFLVVFTEAHWLRLWALTDKPVMRRQVRGALSTAAIWTILSICGLLAFAITRSTGDRTAIDLVSSFTGAAGSFVAAIFWLGAAAALFATSDIQMYSALLLHQFNPKTGSVDDTQFARLKPTILSFCIAITFLGLYSLARFFDLPFEKIIFVIVPFSLNMMPGFTALLKRRQPRAFWIATSLCGYLAFALVGFFRPDTEYVWTLAASLVPVVVSLIVAILTRSAVNGR